MSEFKTIRLGDYVEKIGSGATPRGGQEVYQESGISLIRSQNVYNNYFSADGLAYINDKQAEKLSNVTVEIDDILLNITGDSVARVCQVPEWALPARVNQHVAIVRPNKEFLDPLFVRYYLVSPRMQSFMLTLAGSGATRKALTKGMIENFQIPIPPLSEQRAIAEILGSLDDKIEANRRMNETLEATARAIFKSWFVDFDPVHYKANGVIPPGMDAETAALFPDSFEESELGPIPCGWRVMPISDFLAVNPLRNLKQGKTAPYLSMPNVPINSMRPDTWEYRVFGSGTRFVNGDVLLARITPSLENGKTVYVDFLEPGQVGWGSTEYIVLRSPEGYPTEYAYFMARDPNFRDYAIANMTGTSGRQRVPTESLDFYYVVIPPQPLAKRLGFLIQPMSMKMKHNTEQCQTLEEIRDALLPKLVSGELRVGEV